MTTEPLTITIPPFDAVWAIALFAALNYVVGIAIARKSLSVDSETCGYDTDRSGTTSLWLILGWASIPGLLVYCLVLALNRVVCGPWPKSRKAK